MEEYGTYPKAYHLAVSHLVAHGGHTYAQRGRKLVASALRALRRDFGSERARKERLHMLFISGHFPVKQERAETVIEMLQAQHSVDAPDMLL